MPKQPPPKPTVEAKMRKLARDHVGRYGWPAGELALNALVHALQAAVPVERPKEVTQSAGARAGRRGRTGGSAARSGARAGSGTRKVAQAATGASEAVEGPGGAA